MCATMMGCNVAHKDSARHTPLAAAVSELHDSLQTDVSIPCLCEHTLPKKARLSLHGGVHLSSSTQETEAGGVQV